ncbi:hypothetical protein HUE56_24120 (plasmid) [Azospirillum oryzae]|uniref:Uncharacterized protein n=1 Tax=Azospirillum oryzae TaxID=286727 RepID=A0A6N1AP56_9PROT|nr:hypothetical protein [Azospirillum oryzae]KAA0586352.1 hypothetical protein FZ938_22000 [Azospirillum oryzae]QKS53585.1 hypothetical protein HUE56_24120 [Azospirillum oryzae]GLR81506.1 hypothetical protein GCM10007856_41940 [Azospirillum oryzae]
MLEFNEIVEDSLGSRAPNSCEYAQVICEDKWINGCSNGKMWNYAQIPNARNYISVIVILESPHIEEFNRQIDGTFVQVGPAAGFKRGRSGYRIQKFLENRYLSLIPNYKINTPLFLVNAVQYQCSLNRKLTEAIAVERDKVFKAVWERGGCCNFVERLSSYYQPGDIVVNACTGNKKQDAATNLKLTVEAGIIAALEGKDGREATNKLWGNSKKDIRVISDIGIHHPSSKCFERQPPIWILP